MELKFHEKEIEKNLDLFWISACELIFKLVEWAIFIALFRYLWKITDRDIFYYINSFLTFAVFMYLQAYMKHYLTIEIFERPVTTPWKRWFELSVVLLMSVALLAALLFGVAAVVNGVAEQYPKL